MNFCFLRKHRKGYWNIFRLLTKVIVVVLHNSELSQLIGSYNTGKFNCSDYLTQSSMYRLG